MKPQTLITILVILAFGSTGRAQFPLDATGPTTLTIQAFVDGPSELHVKADGIYWVNGANAKPGRHEGVKYPTYVNGEVWYPLWHKEHEERGEDKSFLHVISMASLDFDLKLISVGMNKNDTGISPRTPIETRHQDGEYIVTIPDPEPGAMWYKFVLTPRKE